MKAILVSFLVAILPALATIVSAVPTPNDSTTDYAKQAMSLSCSNLKLRDGRFLDADCLEPPSWPAATTFSAELDLNNCLANRWGHLDYAYPGGAYANTCSFCSLEGPKNTSIGCMCPDGKNTDPNRPDFFIGSAFDLDDWKYIRNSQGTLTCAPSPTNMTRRAFFHRGRY
ncbi:hypothetical protein F4820DRAFT_420567 [Hypoxylon rubiginosum]|uniref:Uncharacterized protein n=1 Tax=Hypoxylon rubiginosum TaxID=110542 RepID=A0ACB9Z0W4_9PEZI|nr:hypothetical protein F4820DRAFT_420567 [Hypoxylon rubiginosum]